MRKLKLPKKDFVFNGEIWLDDQYKWLSFSQLQPPRVWVRKPYLDGDLFFDRGRLNTAHASLETTSKTQIGACTIAVEEELEAVPLDCFGVTAKPVSYLRWPNVYFITPTGKLEWRVVTRFSKANCAAFWKDIKE